MTRGESSETDAPVASPPVHTGDSPPEGELAQVVLSRLKLFNRQAFTWDGSPEGLAHLASQIREGLGYRSVTISLLSDGTITRRSADPDSGQPGHDLSARDIERCLASDGPICAEGISPTLLVPLVAGTQRVGVLEIGVEGSESALAAELWEILGPHVASILVGGQLEVEANDVRCRAQVLHDVTRHLTSGLDLDAVLADVLRVTVPCVGADDGSVLLFTEQLEVAGQILYREDPSRQEIWQALWRTSEDGLVRWMVQNGQGALIADAGNEERWNLQGERAPFRSVLGMPLRCGNCTRGLIYLVHREPGRFDQADLSFISTVADQAAIAVENVHLGQQAQQRIQELELVSEISQAASSLHLNDVLHIVTQRIVEALPARRCAAFLLDDSHRSVVLRAVNNPNLTDDNMALVVSLTDRPHIAGAIETHRPIEIEDVYADERLRGFWDKARELDIRSQLAVPLITRQRVIGAISIDRGDDDPPFSEAELKLFQTIAHQAANAIENARLYEEVQRRAERLWLANSISRDIGTQLDIHQLMWEVVRLIRETFDCYYVAVGLIEGDELDFRAGISYLYQTTPKLGLSLRGDEPSIAGWAARRGRSVRVRDVREDPRYRARPGLEDVRSQLSVPLRVRDRAQTLADAPDQTIGVLDVGSTEVGAFTEDDQQLLEALAAQVSIAIENARLFSRVQEERATLEAIINGTNDAIIITDTADCVLFLNPAAHEAFGNGEKLRPGKLLREAVDCEDLLELWENGTRSSEIPLPDGRTLHASIAAVPEVGKVAVMQDITYLKELDGVKSDFVSTVSHDLRSPLQVIQTSAELIPRLGDVNQEQRRQVEHILAIVRRISELVRNLLDIGRIEAGVGMDIEPCALDEIIARAAASCRSLAQDKGLAFTVDLPRALPIVQGNPVRLDQVVTNLLSNAIKFTPDGSVSITAREENGQVVIEVRDTGIGIPLDAQERLFEKFYRVQSPDTRGIQGTGLGLAIAKSIVESYGGEIEVQSLPQLGSTFTVSLPVSGEPRASGV